MLAAVKCCKPATEFLIELRQLSRTGMVVLLEQPERFPYDFASRIVAARPYLGVDEFLKFRSKGYVHDVISCFSL